MATKGTVGQLLVEMRADLGKLRVDVKEMEGVFKSGFSNVENFAKSFTNVLGAAFSAGAIIAYGKQLIDLGGHLKDLSQQTGISGQTLSGLKSTLEENGTSLEAFAKGIFTLQKNLGGIKNESDPAAAAVKALGLNLDELRKADTETFLQLVTDALGKVENPINRAALGAQLLSKNFRELGPAINEMAGRLAELRKGGLSDEDINRLDEFGDSLTRLNNRIKLLAAEGLATLIRDLSNINFLFSQMFNKSAAVGAILGGAEGIAARAKTAEPFKPPVDTAGIKKLTDQVDTFIAGLQKQADALRVNITEMVEGDQAAKALGLDFEFAALKARLLADNLKIPPDAQNRFDQLKTSILGLNAELSEMKRRTEENQALSKAWVKDIDNIITAQEKWAAIKMDASTLGMDDLSRQLDEISKKYIKLIVDAQAAAEAAGALPDEIEAVTRRLLIERALEQVRARAGFTGEGVDAEEQAKQRADKLGEDLANSLTSGLRNTLAGIETGQQTLGEGMKNLVRNMLLELQGAIFDKGVLEPLKAIAAGFISGLVGALDDAANDQLRDWAKNLGQSLNAWLSESIGGLGNLFGSSAASGASALGGEINLGFEHGGRIPSFAGGGLFIGHGGEFVMQKKAVDSIGADTLAMANRSGKLPDAAPNIKVTINGDIIPREPTMKKEDVIQIGLNQLDNRGIWMQSLEQRMSPRR